jgi:hypothetical protein
MKDAETQKSTAESAGYIAGLGLGMTRQAMRGKHISASIIVVAAAILILGGSYLRHDDTKLFVQVVGCIVLAIGLGGWFVSVTEK